MTGTRANSVKSHRGVVNWEKSHLEDGDPQTQPIISD